MEAAAAAKAAADAGAAAKAAADALGAQAALAPELPKEPCGGAGGMAEDKGVWAALLLVRWRGGIACVAAAAQAAWARNWELGVGGKV